MTPAVRSLRSRIMLNTPVPTPNHTIMDIMNQSMGLDMKGSTMYALAHAVCTTDHSPVSRSSMSNASEPAKMTCMTSSDVDCRSLIFSCCSMSLELPRISSCRRNICVSAIVSAICLSPFTSCLAPSSTFCMSSMRTWRSFRIVFTLSTWYRRYPDSSVGSAYMEVSCSSDSRRYRRTSSRRMMSLEVSDRVCRILGMEFGSCSYLAMSCRAVLSVSSMMNSRLNTLCTNTSRDLSDKNANMTGSCILLCGPMSMIPCEPVMTMS